MNLYCGYSATHYEKRPGMKSCPVSQITVFRCTYLTNLLQLNLIHIQTYNIHIHITSINTKNNDTTTQWYLYIKNAFAAHFFLLIRHHFIPGRLSFFSATPIFYPKMAAQIWPMFTTLNMFNKLIYLTCEPNIYFYTQTQ